MDESKEESVGTRIYLLRTGKGYSREYLAERAEISSKFLYEIEIRNKGFSAHTLSKLAKSLEVTTDYILYGKGNVRYDQKIAATIEQFRPDTLETVKRLLILCMNWQNLTFRN